MVRRELRQKYKGSTLGVLWYLVNPLILMGAYALVFNVLLKVATVPDYPLFLICGLIVWVFFSQALLASAPSLVVNAPLIRKVRFPRETIPASVAAVQLVTFLVMLVLVVPVALIVRGNLDVSLLLLPVVAVGAVLPGARLLARHLDPARPLPRRRAGAGRAAPAVVLHHADLPARGGLPGRESHQWLADLLEWGNPVAPFVDSVRQIVYAGRRRRWARCVYVVGVGAGGSRARRRSRSGAWSATWR